MSLSFFVALLIICFLAMIIASLSSHDDSVIDHQTYLNKIETIDDLLPQTQCGDCGFNGCLPYAEALARNETTINRCLPGGDETIKELATLLNKEVISLYKDAKDSNGIAFIDEATCIGCVKCITACPVDAIIGAPKQMHSIINQYCTGCELCIAPCPVDCISMVVAR